MDLHCSNIRRPLSKKCQFRAKVSLFSLLEGFSHQIYCSLQRIESPGALSPSLSAPTKTADVPSTISSWRHEGLSWGLWQTLRCPRRSFRTLLSNAPCWRISDPAGGYLRHPGCCRPAPTQNGRPWRLAYSDFLCLVGKVWRFRSSLPFPFLCYRERAWCWWRQSPRSQTLAASCHAQLAGARHPSTQPCNKKLKQSNDSVTVRSRTKTQHKMPSLTSAAQAVQCMFLVSLRLKSAKFEHISGRWIPTRTFQELSYFPSWSSFASLSSYKAKASI